MYAGSDDSANGLPEKLQQLAARILPYTEGNYTPSPPPALLGQLTDHLLVVASDAVASASSCAAGAVRQGEAPLAGLARRRREGRDCATREGTRRDGWQAPRAPGTEGAQRKRRRLSACASAAHRRALCCCRRPVARGIVPEPSADAESGPTVAPAVPPAIPPAAAPTATTAAPDAVATADVAAQYDLACELHKDLAAARVELSSTQEKLRAAQQELEAERAATLRDEVETHREQLSVVHMLQDALCSAAFELKCARKRLRDPDEDSKYLEALFAERSYIDRDEWLEVCRGRQEVYDESEAARPTEIYGNLARESWSELCKRAQDPARCAT